MIYKTCPVAEFLENVSFEIEKCQFSEIENETLDPFFFFVLCLTVFEQIWINWISLQSVFSHSTLWVESYPFLYVSLWRLRLRLFLLSSYYWIKTKMHCARWTNCKPSFNELINKFQLYFFLYSKMYVYCLPLDLFFYFLLCFSAEIYSPCRIYYFKYL